MDEDVNKQEEGQVEQPEVKEPSPIEQRAMEMGWRPLEEFNGDEEDFIDAKEFVRRKPLFDRIEHQSRELKNVKKALDSFKLHYTKVEEVAVQKAISALKAQRREALNEGDGERFDAIDDQIQDAQRQLQVIEASRNTPAVDSQEPHPDFVAFKQRNGWYQTNAEMTQYADQVGLGLANTGLAPEKVLAEVEQLVRIKFKDSFRNPRKDSAPDVQVGRPAKGASQKDDFELTPDEKKIMNDLVRTGVMTKEEYIKSLKTVR